MNQQALAFLLLLSGGITLPAYYFYLRRFKGLEGSTRACFTAIAAFFLVCTIVSGFMFAGEGYGLVILGIGAGLWLLLGVAKKERSGAFYISKDSKRNLLFAGIIIFGVLFITAVTFYTSCIKDWSSLSVEPTTIIPSFEYSLFFLVMTAINLIPLFDLYDARNKRNMQLGMLVVALVGSIIFSIFQFYITVYGGAMDAFSNILFASMREPILTTSIGIMIFGALLKTLNYWQAGVLGNIFISWYPSLIWSMIFVGVYPVPRELTLLFTGFAFFGWFVYLLIMAIVFIIIIAAVSLFTGLSEKISLGP